MAVISHRHRCIYVVVPKCASTSVLDWFLVHGAGRHTKAPAWYPGALAERMPRVAWALALHPHYFSFTFLRNPYRRFLSLHAHASRHAGERAGRVRDHPASYGSPAEFAALTAELLADSRGLWGADARAFFRAHAERRYGPLGIRLGHLESVAGHVRPQVDFLPDCNAHGLFGVPRPCPRPLSFIGAVETVEADFARVRRILGLPGPGLGRRNVSGANDRRDPAGALDAGTRRLVEAIYADDFAFTGCPAGDGRAVPGRRAGRGPVRAAGGGGRAPGAERLRRGLFRLAGLEMALEARIVGLTRVRRALAPLARLRRRACRRGVEAAAPRRTPVPGP